MVTRGDIVVVSLAGDYGKPRPALVIQSDATLAVTGSVTFCLLTSEIIEGSHLRIDVPCNAETGLKRRSQVQTDKIFTLPMAKIRGPIGRIGNELMSSIDLALALHLGLLAR